MKSTKRVAIVLITAPDKRTARKLARAALKGKLIGCANLIANIESHYWWERKIQSGNEVLLLLKTTSERLKALERLILSLHPYDTPEFIVLKVNRGNKRYLTWLAGCVQ
jgi:periplasmic divalent cation tolerance protein